MATIGHIFSWLCKKSPFDGWVFDEYGSHFNPTSRNAVILFVKDDRELLIRASALDSGMTRLLATSGNDTRSFDSTSELLKWVVGLPEPVAC